MVRLIGLVAATGRDRHSRVRTSVKASCQHSTRRARQRRTGSVRPECVCASVYIVRARRH